jgi:hypothetical protein
MLPWPRKKILRLLRNPILNPILFFTNYFELSGLVSLGRYGHVENSIVIIFRLLDV